MTGDLISLLFGIVGEAVGEAIVPERVTRAGLVAWWMFTAAAIAGATLWYRADPTSAVRAGIGIAACTLLPGLGTIFLLIWRDERAERSRARWRFTRR